MVTLAFHLAAAALILFLLIHIARMQRKINKMKSYVRLISKNEKMKEALYINWQARELNDFCNLWDIEYSSELGLDEGEPCKIDRGFLMLTHIKYNIIKIEYRFCEKIGFEVVLSMSSEIGEADIEKFSKALGGVKASVLVCGK